MKTGTQADLKRYLESEYGIEIRSRNTISKLVKAGDYRIIKTPQGKIKLEESAKALVDSGFGKRAELINRKNQAVKKPSSKKPAKTQTPEEHKQDIDNSGPLTLDDSRERIERHKAFHQSEKERINNEEKLKKLIDINTLSDRVFNFVRQFREHQQGQKDRIGSKVEGAESRHEIERIIEDDNHHGLSIIAEDFDTLDDEALKKKILQILIR